MELDFQNFQSEYTDYCNVDRHIQISINNNIADVQRAEQLMLIYNDFLNLDVKMRLAFGIREIRLNNVFVQDKEGDLKMCHLFYYKLADLWFAYETFMKLFASITGVIKNKINWLGTAAYNNYANDAILTDALDTANNGFGITYGTVHRRDELKGYLNYCLPSAVGTQRTRLTSVLAKISGGPFILTHPEVLTIVYAIRNNFVHNGETTVVPAIFGYQNKRELLGILYPYLCLLLLRSINISCSAI